MRKMTILILGLVLNHYFIKAQINQDSIEYLIKDLIDKVNNLPLTNVLGQGDFKFQSKYELKWNKKNQILTLSDTRYKPNSANKTSDELYTEFEISSLHSVGVLIRSIEKDNNLSLQLFTAKNQNKIKTIHSINGRNQFGMLLDRLTIGSWDSIKIDSDLHEIKKILVNLIDMQTNWSENDAPDILKTAMPETIKQAGFRDYSITYEQNDSSPLFLNSTIEEPALFLGANSESDNRDKINDYIISEIDKKGLKFKGNFSGSIIVSKTGKVEDFKSFNMNNAKIEIAVKEIILLMPDWKAGKQKGEFVRTVHTILIKK